MDDSRRFVHTVVRVAVAIAGSSYVVAAGMGVVGALAMMLVDEWGVGAGTVGSVVVWFAVPLVVGLLMRRFASEIADVVAGRDIALGALGAAAVVGVGDGVCEFLMRGLDWLVSADGGSASGLDSAGFQFFPCVFVVAGLAVRVSNERAEGVALESGPRP